MAQLFIPTPLRKFTDGHSTFTSDADRVDGLLQAFVEAHSAVRPHLYDEAGTLRSFIRIYVGDEDLEALDGLETSLDPATAVSIIPAIAGGLNTLQP